MKEPQSQNLNIPIRCSRWLKGFYVATFTIAIFVLVLPPLSHSARALLFVLTLLASFPVIRQIKFLSSVQSFHFRGDDMSLSVGGDRVPVEFVGNHLVSGVLTVFSCRPVERSDDVNFGLLMVRALKGIIASEAMHFVILPDSLSSADHHALRLRLKGSI
ncbi:MAG: hypothetical protein K6L80_01485 [Agarilytica sp.]